MKRQFQEAKVPGSYNFSNRERIGLGAKRLSSLPYKNTVASPAI